MKVEEYITYEIIEQNNDSTELSEFISTLQLLLDKSIILEDPHEHN
jgi:hypothetical protein